MNDYTPLLISWNDKNKQLTLLSQREQVPLMHIFPENEYEISGFMRKKNCIQLICLREKIAMKRDVTK
jgi:hypothetical protein